MSLSIRAELNKSLSEDFELIKDFLGLENNTDAIRSLIKSKAREIRQKEQLPVKEPSEQEIEAL